MAPPPAPQPQPSTAAASGPSTADLRRLWPQILEEVKSRKRFTHALLSQNAQVVEVRGSDLLLGFANQGTLERFQSGGSIEVLRECLIAVLGADLRISAAVDGGPSAAGQHQQAVPSQPGDEPDHEPQPVPHHYQAVHDEDRRQAAPERGSSPHDGQNRRPETPEADMGDIVTAEDVVLDESGVDAAELLMRQLGAQIIDEQDNLSPQRKDIHVPRRNGHERAVAAGPSHAGATAAGPGGPGELGLHRQRRAAISSKRSSPVPASWSVSRSSRVPSTSTTSSRSVT